MAEIEKEMQLDYIDLGELTPEQIAACSEINRIWDIKNPTLIRVMPNETFIFSGGILPHDKFTDMDKIPKGMKKVRCFYDGRYSIIDTVLSFKDLVVYFIYPQGVVESSIVDFIRSNLINVMTKFNIEVGENLITGSIEINSSEGVPKRVIHFGTPQSNKNSIGVVAVQFMFDNNIQIMRECFKVEQIHSLCAKTMTTLADYYHEGFLSMYPSLDRTAVADEVAVQFAKSLNLELNTRTASTIELESLNGLSERLNNDDWIINAIHPDVITKLERLRPPTMQNLDSINEWTEFKVMMETLPKIGDLKEG